MREYIKENNAITLFFFHLLFPVLELILKGVTNIFATNIDTTIILAGAFGVAHIALISQIYKKSVESESLNYLLSLSESRDSILKDILEMYGREIVVYTLSLVLFMVFTNADDVLLYAGVRLLFAVIAVPIFLNNILETYPLAYGFLSIYYVFGSRNIGVLILISIPISVYLMIKFKKTILEGNLI